MLGVGAMSDAVIIDERRAGRPSRYPVVVQYCEAAEIDTAMRLSAERMGLSVSEFQRIVNRAGLQALNLMPPR